MQDNVDLLSEEYSPPFKKKTPWHKLFIIKVIHNHLAFFKFLSFFNLICLLKAFNIKKMFSAIHAKSSLLKEGLADKFIEAVMVFFFFSIIVLLAAIGIMFIEKGHNEQFVNIIDGLWWAMVTLTTVGYGDKFPITVSGRILATFMMLIGLGFFALMTSLISSFILDAYKKIEERGVRMNGLKDHIIVSGWNANTETVLEELQDLYEEKKDIVVISEEKPQYIFSKKIYFFQGDCTKKEVLVKAGILNAQSIVILSDTSSGRQEQDMDARTILAVLSAKKINPDIYASAEIYSAENAEHLINSGVDEYVVTASYAGKLLAHSIKNAGITKVYDELLKAREGNQFYILKVPSYIVGISFGECGNELLNRRFGILVGIEKNGEFLMNPYSETILEEGNSLICIGKKSFI